MVTVTRAEIVALPADVRVAAIQEAMDFYRDQNPGRWTEEQLLKLAEADISFQMSGGVKNELNVAHQFSEAEREAA